MQLCMCHLTFTTINIDWWTIGTYIYQKSNKYILSALKKNPCFLKMVGIGT